MSVHREMFTRVLKSHIGLDSIVFLPILMSQVNQLPVRISVHREMSTRVLKGHIGLDSMVFLTILMTQVY